jgi:hypothetical protein
MCLNVLVQGRAGVLAIWLSLTSFVSVCTLKSYCLEMSKISASSHVNYGRRSSAREIFTGKGLKRVDGRLLVSDIEKSLQLLFLTL